MNNNLQIAAVDVGTFEVKVLIGKGNNGSFDVIASGSAPTQGFSKGMVTDTEALATSVRQAVDCVALAADTDISQVYLGVCGLGYNSRNVVGTVAPISTQITQQDLKRACKAALLTELSSDDKLLHALPTCYYIDGDKCWNPTGKQADRLDVEVHLITIVQDTVDDLTVSLKKKGIDVLGIMANSIAGANTMNMEKYRDQNVLYLDCGAGLSDLVLFNKGCIVYSASLPIGGEYITSDIMNAFSLNRAHAEEIKRYYVKLDANLRGKNVILDCGDNGTKDKLYQFDFLYDVIESRIEEIVVLIFEHLQAHLDKYPIDNIVLTGGNVMPSMSHCLERVFKLKPQIFYPCELTKEYASPSNTVCYGILKHAFSNHNIKIIEEQYPSLGFWDKLKNIFK